MGLFSRKNDVNNHKGGKEKKLRPMFTPEQQQARASGQHVAASYVEDASPDSAKTPPNQFGLRPM